MSRLRQLLAIALVLVALTRRRCDDCFVGGDAAAEVLAFAPPYPSRASAAALTQSPSPSSAAAATPHSRLFPSTTRTSCDWNSIIALRHSPIGDDGGGSAEREKEEEILGPLAAAAAAARDADAAAANREAAATKTVNERLLAELQEATDKEKFGARSSMGKKMGMDGFGAGRKTDEERRAAIEEARDLNGVNPAVAIAGSVFALAAAAGLWALTSWLAEFFALHPVPPDSAYFVQRVSGVFRNVVMGLVSLASGFFGVTGVGIFLLGIRVAYGVAKGELDPTPIKKEEKDGVELPNVWDLMTGQTGRRARKRKDNNSDG